MVVENQLTIIIKVYFQTLNSVPLIYIFFMPAPCYLDYSSFAVSCDIGIHESNFVLFLKNSCLLWIKPSQSWGIYSANLWMGETGRRLLDLPHAYSLPHSFPIHTLSVNCKLHEETGDWMWFMFRSTYFILFFLLCWFVYLCLKGWNVIA